MPITYSYGFEFEGSIYSVSGLTFEDIAELITLQMASKTTELDNLYKLRFNPTKLALQRFKEKHENKLIKIGTVKPQGSTLWSTLERYRAKYNPPGINKGQMYEVYRSILLEEKVKNGPPAPELEEEYVLSKFIEIRKNNLSWTKGGDVGTEQDKFMRASLTSAKTLTTTLKELIDILNSKNIDINLVTNQIMTLFSNQKFDEMVLEKGQKKLIQTIEDEVIKTLPKT